MHAKQGAAMNIRSGTAGLISMSFVNGTASAGGGALFAANTARATLHNCTLQGCATDTYAGAALLLDGVAQVTLVHCSISDCRTGEGGGAIACH